MTAPHATVYLMNWLRLLMKVPREAAVP